ncbi:MAG: transposon-transfer assisting family protein [Proteiniphilum sp.]|nr:transposon-transfer assisting family protein [Proteiniphilum sp.]MDD3908597.1 transposon-transfer assisting family protein [Proteiniphilum sp.]MDD4415924.1 transposon-transfer assisting family protein [Proteiniphilum sp.]
MEQFIVEEINLMCIYDTGTRRRLLSDMCGNLPHVYEPELKALILSMIVRLESMTDEEYGQLVLVPEYGDDEQEE